MHKNVIWNTGSAAERFQHNRKKILESRKRKKLQASSFKLQAPSPRTATIKKDNKT